MNHEIKPWGTFYAGRTRPDGPNMVFTSGLEIYTLTSLSTVDVRIEPNGTVLVMPDNPNLIVRELGWSCPTTRVRGIT